MSVIGKVGASFIFFFCVFFLSTSSLFAASSTLSRGYVFPSWAVPGGTVVYRVFCKTVANSVPDYVRLHLGSATYDLAKVSNSSGSDLYELKFEIPSSWKQAVPFFFTAGFGDQAMRFPVNGAIEGPVILPEKYVSNKIVFMDKEGEIKWIYSTGEDWVQNLVLSDDGSYLAAKTTDKIYFFSSKSPDPLWIYECQSAGQGNNYRYYGGWVDLSDKGEFIAGGCQNTLHIFNRDGRIVWSYPARVSRVSNSKDGFFTAITTLSGGKESKPGQTILFSNAIRKPIWNHFASGSGTSVAVSDDGTYVASGESSPNSAAYLFLLSGPEPILNYPVEVSFPIEHSEISSDGSYSFYGIRGDRGFSGNVLVYSVLDEEITRTYNLDGGVYALSVSADGQHIAAGGQNGVLTLWNQQQDSPVWTYSAPEEIGAVAISGNGKVIVGGDKSGDIFFATAERGNWESLQSAAWMHSLGNPINTLSLSYAGSYVAVGTGPQSYINNVYTPEYDTESSFATCGDDICSTLWGEDENTCPQDCAQAVDEDRDSNVPQPVFSPFSFFGSPSFQRLVLGLAFLIVALLVVILVFFVYKRLRGKKEQESVELSDDASSGL